MNRILSILLVILTTAVVVYGGGKQAEVKNDKTVIGKKYSLVNTNTFVLIGNNVVQNNNDKMANYSYKSDDFIETKEIGNIYTNFNIISVAENNIDVFKKNSTKSPRIGSLKSNDFIIIVSKNNDWNEIVYNGFKGWIKSILDISNHGNNKVYNNEDNKYYFVEYHSEVLAKTDEEFSIYVFNNKDYLKNRYLRYRLRGKATYLVKTRENGSYKILKDISEETNRLDKENYGRRKAQPSGDGKYLLIWNVHSNIDRAMKYQIINNIEYYDKNMNTLWKSQFTNILLKLKRVSFDGDKILMLETTNIKQSLFGDNPIIFGRLNIYNKKGELKTLINNVNYDSEIISSKNMNLVAVKYISDRSDYNLCYYIFDLNKYLYKKVYAHKSVDIKLFNDFMIISDGNIEYLIIELANLPKEI